jgi:signal transduction histidine kinase
LDPGRSKRGTWLSWACVSLLAALCGVLAVMQYRWIDEVAAVEHERLTAGLQTRLALLRRAFNDRIATAVLAFTPSGASIEKLGRDQAYLDQYRREKDRQPLVRRIALAAPQGESVALFVPDLDGNRFSRVDWPPEWKGMQERLTARMRGEPVAPERGSTLIEAPRFGAPRGGPPGEHGSAEQEWLLVDLNVDYIRSALLPLVLNRYLGDEGGLDYDAEVVVNGDPSNTIFHSASEQNRSAPFVADGSVSILEVSMMRSDGMRGDGPRRGGPMPPSGGGGPESFMRPRAFPDRDHPSGPPTAPDSGRGAWILMVHHHAGSLQALTAQARRRNIALSGGVLLLIVATAASMLRVSRRAQQVAEIQMNFVAGVSHELRTPLTVIRTAAFNLRGRFASRPDHVERYGELIQAETEKLTELVEQVLRYGSARAGRVIQDRGPVAVEALIEDSLKSCRIANEEPELIVEKQVEPGLPLVLADEAALRHALRNLLDNAVKYGTGESNWIGISAARVAGPAVEIRVIDRGPGIPRQERDRIFDSFFRGQRALEDQVHGTGLGLDLAKRIVEAHGGEIRVNSEPMKGTEFIVRIPAAPPEMQDEFAHSAG